ncbi:MULTISPECIES: hypothetical protein [unclassified Crossiella]|uniref:hypothetical protein n=1 Tax=unclassified Crossiella TaxID=2620835 RepID=UPI001FFF2681|nr:MULTISPECIES: hypothetical protein [unclassified Crossiella]MCK2239382.1 hypothetical protein [Crossiella sp. S99.2]MCK2252077.1 hypothetical protein [Crossiella sp. S99.1]
MTEGQSRDGMITVWAVYVLPLLTDGERAVSEYGANVADLLKPGKPRVLFMTDGTEPRRGGRCTLCVRAGFDGDCPGSLAHAYNHWFLESHRNVWEPVEMGVFQVHWQDDRATREKLICYQIVSLAYANTGFAPVGR